MIEAHARAARGGSRSTGAGARARGRARLARRVAAEQPAASVSARFRSPDCRRDGAAAPAAREVPPRRPLVARHASDAPGDVGLVSRRAGRSRPRGTRSRRLRSVVGPIRRLQRSAPLRRDGPGADARRRALVTRRAGLARSHCPRTSTPPRSPPPARAAAVRSRSRCSIKPSWPASAISTRARRCTSRGSRRGCAPARSRPPAARRGPPRAGWQRQSSRFSRARLTTPAPTMTAPHAFTCTIAKASAARAGPARAGFAASPRRDARRSTVRPVSDEHISDHGLLRRRR